MKHITVKTKEEAWTKANEIFPTDYEKDESGSQNAGYPIYKTTSTDEKYNYFWISDLGTRLELNMGSESVEIWIKADEFENLPAKEQKEIAKKFEVWLRPYTMKTIVKVLENRNEILSNEFAMRLIDELYQREKEEEKQRQNSMEYLLRAFDDFNMYDIHNDSGSHANSYRDVLYDMYVK